MVLEYCALWYSDLKGYSSCGKLWKDYGRNSQLWKNTIVKLWVEWIKWNMASADKKNEEQSLKLCSSLPQDIVCARNACGLKERFGKAVIHYLEATSGLETSELEIAGDQRNGLLFPSRDICVLLLWQEGCECVLKPLPTESPFCSLGSAPWNEYETNHFQTSS